MSSHYDKIIVAITIIIIIEKKIREMMELGVGWGCRHCYGFGMLTL